MFIVTETSAVNLARWHVQQKMNLPGTPLLTKMGLNVALTNGSIEELFRELYQMGFAVAADERYPTVQAYQQQGAIQRDDSRSL